MTKRTIRSRTSASSSSVQMEHYKRLDEVVLLGNQLIKELALASDPTSCWMAHYCAELIKKIETSTETERVKAERECYETILQLWEHRTSLATRKRPLESFNPILDTLETLSKKGAHRYFGVVKKPKTDEIGKLVDLAENVDDAARSLINWLLAQATAIAADKEKNWLKTGVPFVKAPEQDALIALALYAKLAGEEKAEDFQDLKLRQLKEIEENLSKIIEVSGDVRAIIQKEIEVEKKSASKAKKKSSK